MRPCMRVYVRAGIHAYICMYVHLCMKEYSYACMNVRIRAYERAGVIAFVFLQHACMHVRGSVKNK